MRSFHYPGRSPVYARRAMCATSHPLASLAAIETLKSGGNAVDAAITAAAVLCVVEHPMTGIGGDCFAILAKPDGKLIAMNASGRAPQAATAAWYADHGIRQIEQQSPHAVTVPGAIAGWTKLAADHGALPLGQLLAPAIHYSESGFAVAPRVAADWAVAEAKLSAREASRRHFLKDGRAPRTGEVMRFPALAKTLERLAKGGRDEFYEGETAKDMVATLHALGGLHTLDDFKAQDATYVEPISVCYGGIDLFQLPPNNQGIVALIMLKVLDRLGLVAGHPAAPERYHALIEAARLAYGMRDAYIADPDTSEFGPAGMLADDLIDTLARRIDLKRRTPDLGPLPRPVGSDTVYLSVVDEQGMAVSFINSLFSDFGTGIATEKTGIVFHNRGQGFVLDPKHPNCIGPRQRPMHTLVPAMAMRDGRLFASFGVMGAAFQPIGHVFTLTNLVDYGMDPQEALDFPRVFFEGNELQVEEAVPAATVARLREMGHDVTTRTMPWGGGQIVYRDHANGVLIGASDPRKDGCALGY